MENIRKQPDKREVDKKVVPRDQRRWPKLNPAKNGCLPGHCMNND